MWAAAEATSLILMWNGPLRLPQFSIIISGGDTASLSSASSSSFLHPSLHSHLDNILLRPGLTQIPLDPIHRHSSSFVSYFGEESKNTVFAARKMQQSSLPR